MIKKTAFILLFFFLTNSVFAINIEKGEDIDYGNNFYNSGVGDIVFNEKRFIFIPQYVFTGYIKFLNKGIKIKELSYEYSSIVPTYNINQTGNINKIFDNQKMAHFKNSDNLKKFLKTKEASILFGDLKKDVYISPISAVYNIYNDDRIPYNFSGYFNTDTKNYKSYSITSDKDQILHLKIFPIDNRKQEITNYPFYESLFLDSEVISNKKSFKRKNNNVKFLSYADDFADYYNIKIKAHKKDMDKKIFKNYGFFNVSDFIDKKDNSINGDFFKKSKNISAKKKYIYNTLFFSNTFYKNYVKNIVITPYYDIKIPIKKGENLIEFYYENLLLLGNYKGQKFGTSSEEIFDFISNSIFSNILKK